MNYEMPVDSSQLVQPVFSMDRVAALRHLEEIRKYPIQKRVCICGHTVNSHKFEPNFGYICKPGNIHCRCSGPSPVLCASNAKPFLRSTHGYGYKHALGLGIAALEDLGGSVEWMIDLQCQVMNCTAVEVTITCLNDMSRVVAESTPRSAFLCKTHLLELGGSQIWQ